MQEAEVTSIEVNKTSEEYRPVAKRASLLYFCLADMANVDPMYQCARGVLRRCGGFTSLDGLVSISRCRGWFLFQNWGRSGRVE